MAALSAPSFLKSTYCGAQPLAGTAQFVSCSAFRNAWRRNGLSPASVSHASGATDAIDDTTCRCSSTSVVCGGEGKRAERGTASYVTSMAIAITQLDATLAAARPSRDPRRV